MDLEKKNIRLRGIPVSKLYKRLIGFLLIALVVVVSTEMVWLIIKAVIANKYGN